MEEIFFNGIQDDINGAPAYLVFTDRVTKGSFCVPSGSTDVPADVERKLAEMRERFGVATQIKGLLSQKIVYE